MNQIPAVGLIRILPRTKKRRNILRHPDEKARKQKCKDNRHLKSMSSNNECHFGAPIQNDNKCEDGVAEVPNEMMGEEIKVYQSSGNQIPNCRRKIHDMKIKPSPRLGYITRNTCVHKTAVNRNTK